MGQLILTSRSSLCKEGQHVNIDRVNDIEDILSFLKEIIFIYLRSASLKMLRLRDKDLVY